MAIQHLLYQRKIQINDKIGIVVPTVGEVIENEETYYNQVSSLTAMPIDMMCQLDDAGIDFTTINDYELFLLMFQALKRQDTHLIFGDLDLSEFEMTLNERNNMVVLKDEKRDIMIDRAIHGRIAETLRMVNHLKKDIRKPGNDAAKAFMIERARKKLNRKKNKTERSQLETLITAMVNTEQFKYDYESVLGMTIYQFNESVHQIIHKEDYEHRMFGVYTGNISGKELSQEDLNWLEHKSYLS